MKKIFLYLSITLLSGLVLFSSCGNETLDDSIPLNPVLTPFKAVTAEDGPMMAEATISDKDRTIVFEFLNLKNLKEVKVKLNVSKRAKLQNPSDTILTLDLTKPYEININNIYDDLTYTLTASIPEFVLIDKSKFKENYLTNDAKPEGDPMNTIWNNKYIKELDQDGVPKYGTVNYQNFLANGSFTFDIGARYDGSYYDIKQLKVHLYRAYEWTCPKIYELYGYMKPGTPPASGDWADWTKIGSVDNSNATKADYLNGDNINFDKENSPNVRYLRIKPIVNWKGDKFFSISEITLWSWNK